MGVFQRTLLSSLHVSGIFVLLTVPSPSGPRNWGHCASTRIAATDRRVSVKRTAIRFVLCVPYVVRGPRSASPAESFDGTG